MYTNKQTKACRKWGDFMMKCKMEQNNLYYKNMEELTEATGKVLTQLWK